MAKREHRRVLSKIRRAFCDEYHISGNAQEAAIKAGYSNNKAGHRGCTLLKTPLIMEYLNKLKAKEAKRFEVTADRVIQALAAIAFANIHDFWEAIAKSKSPSDFRKHLSREQAAAVASVKMSYNGDITLKLHDKLTALQLLGKRFGLFDDHINIHDDRGIVTVEQLGMGLDEKKALLKRIMNYEAKQETGDGGQG